ncbi:DEAD/DEAH box helicase [Bacillaceae bacterium W0354]
MKQLFESYELSEDMLNIVKKLGFKQPTDIQHQVIPKALKKKNIIGQSQTGSGKTHAYLIPLIDQINSKNDAVQKMIIAPTRELAIQIFEEVQKMIEYGVNDDLTVRLVIGGTDKKRMLDKFKNQPHIVVGTPGRILDFIEQNAIQTSTVSSVVIDEADLLIDLGLINEVDQILYRMYENVQVLVFSATIPKNLQPLLKKYLNNPEHIVIDEKHISPKLLEHRLVPLRHRNVADLIIETSKLINPYIALIFVNKKEHADKLSGELLQRGFEVGVIHGGLQPRERKRVLNYLKTLKYQYIVATDLAARGIDIPGVSHVFNAELPKDVESYTHRVGRTARAGLEGTAVSFYSEEDIPLIEKLEQNGIKFESFDIKNGEWVEVKEWNERQKRKKEESDLEKEAWKQVRKQKTVKPGYKKKMKKEKDQIKRQLKKQQFRKGKR